jgi:hypothetical protein
LNTLLDPIKKTGTNIVNTANKILDKLSSIQFMNKAYDIRSLIKLVTHTPIDTSIPGQESYALNETIKTNNKKLNDSMLKTVTQDWINWKNAMTLLDSMSKVNVPSLWAYLDPDKFSDASQTIGTVNIEINEASFADDADLDEVAREVGRRFTQELERNGMNVTNYSF